MPGHPYAEYIGVGKRTEGTETSKYLEEEKTTVIPLVAASERGRAQTMEVSRRQPLLPWGSRVVRESLPALGVSRDGESNPSGKPSHRG